MGKATWAKRLERSNLSEATRAKLTFFNWFDFLTTIFNHYGWRIFFWSAFTRFDWNVIIYISSRLYSRSRSCQKCLIFGSFDSIVHCLRINRHQCTNHNLQSSCSPTFPQVHHPHFPTQKVDLKTFFEKKLYFHDFQFVLSCKYYGRNVTLIPFHAPLTIKQRTHDGFYTLQGDQESQR